MLCSIFLLSEDGQHLHYGASSGLPEQYKKATNGMEIGPQAGSCGTAAYLQEPVFSADILTDQKWVKFRDQAKQAGLRAAWSNPILSHDGKVLGTLGMYYRKVRHPRPDEIHLIEYASRIAGIAIEREQSQTALRLAFDELKASEAQLQQVVDSVPHHIVVLGPDGRIPDAPALLEREKG
jgi:GAF domain-containing protein